MERGNMKRMFTMLMMQLTLLPGFIVMADEILPKAEDDIVMAPVVVDGTPLFRVRGMSTYPAEKRAAEAARAISKAAADPTVDPDKVILTPQADRVQISCGKHSLIYLIKSEAQQEQFTLENYSLVVQKQIMDAIVRYRHEREPAALWVKIFKATGMIVVALFLFLLWYRFSMATKRFLDNRISSLVKDIQIQKLQIVRRQHLWRAIQILFGLFEWLGIAIMLYVLVFEVLDLFPWTREISQSLLKHFAFPLRGLTLGILRQLPNLIFLLVLLLVVRFVMGLLRAGFQSIASRQMHFAGFEPEWAMATYRLIRLLVVVFTLVVAYPYIPGSSTEAFKACSVFLGILFSIGSSSLIANVMAGYSVTYRRAFRVGDMIKTGEHIGEVLEIRLMATRVRTLKHEEVIIPNSKLIGEEVLNYSSLGSLQRLILHTRVGIGYEVSWRKVEAILLEAASISQGVCPDGAFVLIKELGDFAVSYELNVPCVDPRRMAFLYTELHKNILDAFNKYGVQIMTPAYEADTPAPKIVTPDRWYVPPATPPAPSATGHQSR
jgi:small-conductance mechanosensitive channel